MGESSNRSFEHAVGFKRETQKEKGYSLKKLKEVIAYSLAPCSIFRGLEDSLSNDPGIWARWAEMVATGGLRKGPSKWFQPFGDCNVTIEADGKKRHAV